MTLFDDIQFSTFALIDDNCKIPTKSLLYRLRTRELMEMSASRWDPTPGATAAQNSFSTLLDESFTMTTKPVQQHSAPPNVGPKVPRRQISPPAQKRDNLSTFPASYASPATNASAAKESPPPPPPPPPSPAKMGSPHKPVRSRSPNAQPRSLLGGGDNDDDCEFNASSSSLAAEVSLSLMLSNSQTHPHNSKTQRHTARTSRSNDTTNTNNDDKDLQQQKQQGPRIPQRKISVSKPHAKRGKSAIQQILQEEDEDNDNDDNDNDVDFHSSTPSLLLMKEMDSSLDDSLGRQLSRRPSLPTRQSSFEILPATLPTRQSSFELRHRGASPLTEKVVSEILHHSPSPERTQSSDSMPNLPRRRDDSIQADVEAKLHCSLPILHLCQESDDEEEEARPPRAPRHSARSRYRAKETRRSTTRPTKEDDPLVNRPRRSSPPPLSNSSSKGSKASAHSPAAAKQLPDSRTDRITGIGGSTARSGHAPTPCKPTRRWSLDSHSSHESSTQSASRRRKARHFRWFLPGTTRPSLPVRSSSCEGGFVSGDRNPHRGSNTGISQTTTGSSPSAVGRLPCRHSSFPGLHSTFQKI